jgi:hypothetical protein
MRYIQFFFVFSGTGTVPVNKFYVRGIEHVKANARLSRYFAFRLAPHSFLFSRFGPLVNLPSPRWLAHPGGNGNRSCGKTGISHAYTALVEKNLFYTLRLGKQTFAANCLASLRFLLGLRSAHMRTCHKRTSTKAST